MRPSYSKFKFKKPLKGKSIKYKQERASIKCISGITKGHTKLAGPGVKEHAVMKGKGGAASQGQRQSLQRSFQSMGILVMLTSETSSQWPPMRVAGMLSDLGT